MACDGCTDLCTCVVVGGTDIEVTGTGDVADPYVVTGSFTESVFEATSLDGSIEITPDGDAGHAPNLQVDFCNIIDIGQVEETGQLFVISDDVDCRPHRLVDPAPGQVLGEVGGEAGWVDPGTSSAPTGAVLDFAGPVAPSGFLLCDGASYLVADYPELHAVIGYTYGGVGANFNVPDAQGRVTAGLGTHADVNALGDSDALALGSRRPRHAHTVNNHNHTFFDITSSPSSLNTGFGAGYTQSDWNSVTDAHNGAGNRVDVVAAATSTHNHTASGTTSNENPGTDAQGPGWITFNKIIKT